ncbi:MAG: hypothetical protein DMH00_12605, partial [Acidobacteria bacterium]
MLVRIETFRQGLTSRFRLPTVRISTATLVTTLAAFGLLWTAYMAVLRLRSLKYLLALIVIGIAGVCFLALPKKFTFLLFMLAFSFPFYVEFILIQRDSAVLSVTGTLFITILLGIVGWTTGAIPGRSVILEPRITIFALAFLCSGFLSLANSTDRTMTFIAIAKEAEMVLLFLLIINALRDRVSLEWFLLALYQAFWVECVIYYLQNVLGFSFDIVGNARYTGATDLDSGYIGSQRGTFGTSPTMAALYFSTVSLTLIGHYLCRRKLPIRLQPLLGAALGVGCLVLSTKRAPLGGFVLGLLTIVILIWYSAPEAKTKLFRVLASMTLPILLFLPVLLLRAQADHEGDYEERVNLTRVAWNMYHEHPVIGVGFGTYDTVKRDYLPPDWSGWLNTVHNRYLCILAETGTVGLTIFVFLLG